MMPIHRLCIAFVDVSMRLVLCTSRPPDSPHVQRTAQRININPSNQHHTFNPPAKRTSITKTVVTTASEHVSVGPRCHVQCECRVTYLLMSMYVRRRTLVMGFRSRYIVGNFMYAAGSPFFSFWARAHPPQTHRIASASYRIAASPPLICIVAQFGVPVGG
ncbi:hypothetical protein V8C26DRAFT_12101 [Trichoderma gracile]